MCSLCFTTLLLRAMYPVEQLLAGQDRTIPAVFGHPEVRRMMGALPAVDTVVAVYVVGDAGFGPVAHTHDEIFSLSVNVQEHPFEHRDNILVLAGPEGSGQGHLIERLERRVAAHVSPPGAEQAHTM